MATTDTGTGGFTIGPNNDLYEYDVGVEDESGVKGKWSRGDIKTYTTQQDLSAGTKRTLASYLSKVTLGDPTEVGAAKVKNVYTVDALPVSEISLSTPQGYPLPPQATGNTSKFVDVNASGYSTYETLRTVSKVYAEAFSQETNFVKGRNQLVDADPDKVADGNTLLSGLQLTQENTEVANAFPVPGVLTAVKGAAPPKYGIDPAKNPALSKYSAAMLNNRFMPETPFSTVAGTVSGPQFTKSYELGRSPDAESQKVTYGQLAQVGTLLGARATQDKGSSLDGAVPNSGAALEPSAVQLGAEKIERSLLDAASVLDTLTQQGIGAETLISPMKSSWGVLNNTFDRFSGVSNFGMQLLATAMLLAIGVLFGALALIPFGVPPLAVGAAAGPPATAAQPLGSYKSIGRDVDFTLGGIANAALSGGVDWLSLLGLNSTVQNWAACLVYGTLAFFGIGINANNTSTTAAFAQYGLAVADAAINGSQSPGFNIVIARAVNRSFLGVIEAFGAFSTVDPVQAAKQVFEIIMTIRESKVIGAINVFTALGDAVLLDVGRYDVTSSKRGAGRKISAIDKQKQNDGPGDAAHQKNRLGENGSDLTLAWSTFRAPDRIILPSTTIKSIIAGQKLSAPSSLSTESTHLRTIGDAKFVPHASRDDGRIPTEDREAMESYLDSEYVPFYFHDVRTNEIVSFHAFLASLSDDYTASYDSSSGMGRVEAVKVYKETSRKIGFSFYVAALSENDFDSMWIKINKLTTLVYPQFTKGKYVNTPDDKYRFVAPFSQMISASPMIRVRIGDLIHSNYSKYNLARLFGYGDGSTKFNDKDANDFAKNLDQETLLKLRQEIEDSKSEPGNLFTVSSALPKPVQTVAPASVREGIVAPPGIVFELTAVDGVNARCKAVLAKADDGDFTEQQIAAAAAKHDATVPGYNPQEAIVGVEFLLPKSALRPTFSTLKSKFTTFFGATSSTQAALDYQQAMEEFMNDDPYDQGSPTRGNAVARSFRSAGGKGLAGFIDSLGFDWYDRNTWETKAVAGYKAPKMCKVTVSFSPIHDIAPGLDWQGGNRAPIYPVGPLAQGK
jgi:hypothetical protein